MYEFDFKIPIDDRIASQNPIFVCWTIFRKVLADSVAQIRNFRQQRASKSTPHKF